MIPRPPSCNLFFEGRSTPQGIRDGLTALENNLNATAARNITLMNMAESLDAEILHAFPDL